jgi:2-dehydropantoate 2-reductase
MINPLTVIFNCHNGQLFHRPPIAELMQILLSEAAAVVRALILRFPNGGDDTAILESRFSQPVLEQLVRALATKTGKNISSMLQDVRASRKTEVDYINGYIVARGVELGIDCVHNRTLLQIVRDKRVISESQILDFFPR